MVKPVSNEPIDSLFEIIDNLTILCIFIFK